MFEKTASRGKVGQCGCVDDSCFYTLLPGSDLVSNRAANRKGGNRQEQSVMSRVFSIVSHFHLPRSEQNLWLSKYG